MEPLVLIPGSQHLIMMVEEGGKYFWPEPPVPANTIGDWSPVGYKIKTKNTPACLPIYGDSLLDQSFYVNKPFKFLPVLTNVPVDINNLFGTHVNDVLLIYDWPVGELWTPVASDFDVLLPGRAYLLVNKRNTPPYTIEFPDFDPYAPHLYPTKDNAVINNSPWSDVENTSQPHILIFSEEAKMALEPGDIIGALNTAGECYGMAEYTHRESLYKLVAMGDNQYSARIDGFEIDDQMEFRLYRQRTGETFEILLTYDKLYPSHDGLFTVNGASRVLGITVVVASVNDFTVDYNINVFPNPALEKVNLTCNREIRMITMLNQLGQVVMSVETKGRSIQLDVSTQSTGLYFLSIETEDGNLITKRLAIE